MFIYDLDSIPDDPTNQTSLNVGNKSSGVWEDFMNKVLYSQMHHLALDKKAIVASPYIGNAVGAIVGASGIGGTNVGASAVGGAIAGASANTNQAPSSSSGVSVSCYLTFYTPLAGWPEGGFNDSSGHPLGTVEGYLSGRDPYVSIACSPKIFTKTGKDPKKIRYGTTVRIPVLEKYFGRLMTCRMVDVGDSTYFPDEHHLDVCVDTIKIAKTTSWRDKGIEYFLGTDFAIPVYPPAKADGYNRLDFDSFKAGATK